MLVEVHYNAQPMVVPKIEFGCLALDLLLRLRCKTMSQLM